MTLTVPGKDYPDVLIGSLVILYGDVPGCHRIFKCVNITCYSDEFETLTLVEL